MNKIEITVLSARVLDALSGRGLKAKTVHEFERYGTRRIVKHCLGKGQILYSKETVQNFVWQERAKQESGTLPHYQWGITRRAAVYLDQMAEYGKIQDEPIRPWEAEHNPLFQAISCNPSNSMKVIYRYAEITLPDVTRCLAKISETFPLGIFNLTGSMRSFARFMAEKHPELPDISPALVFSAAKRRRVYVGYTHEDAQKIFSAINRSSTMGMRDYAMIMLAYTTGLRGCDIVNLKFDSIDWDACELRLVQEKTNIPVSLPLDTKTGNAIADYILHARPKCKSEYIFLRVLRPYTKIGSMWTVIAKYAHIALGKDRKMNGPHAFRRGMGRQLLEANIPAPLICDILGHSSSVSLRQYTASSLEKLKVCAGTISAIPIAQEALL